MHKKKLTVEEHQEMADSLSIACHHLNRIYYKLQKEYGKSYPMVRRVSRLISNSNQGIFISVKSDLDTEWQKETKKLSTEEFHELGGFIHYNLRDRYKKLIDENKIPELGVKEDANPGKNGIPVEYFLRNCQKGE